MKKYLPTTSFKHVLILTSMVAISSQSYAATCATDFAGTLGTNAITALHNGTFGDGTAPTEYSTIDSNLTDYCFDNPGFDDTCTTDNGDTVSAPFYPDNGEYVVATSILSQPPMFNWHQGIEASSGMTTDRKLIINGVDGSAGQVFLELRVDDLISNKVYEFSADLLNLVMAGTPSIAKVNFEVNMLGIDDDGDGVIDEVDDFRLVVSANAPQTSGPLWGNHSGAFNTGNSTSALIRLSNASGITGNQGDVAIDNIKLSPCNSPVGSVSGKLFFDLNNNSIFESNIDKDAHSQVQVHLFSSNDSFIAIAETEATGGYNFLGIPAGSGYKARIFLKPDGVLKDVSFVADPPEISGLNVQAGTPLNSQNFVIKPPAIILSPTVNRLISNTASPTLITGNVILQHGDVFSVTLNGTTYNMGSPELSLMGSQWALAVTTPFAEGSYDVNAKITHPGGVINDTTNMELSVDLTSPPVPTVNTIKTAHTTTLVTGSAIVTTGDSLSVSVAPSGMAGSAKIYTLGDGALTLTNDIWSLQIPSSDNLQDGTTYEVIAKVKDEAGNFSEDITNNEVVVDSMDVAMNARVGLAILDIPAKVNDAFVARFEFSEPVNGFTPADITVVNANIDGELINLNAGKTYLARFIPTGSNISFSVPAGVVSAVTATASGHFADNIAASASTEQDLVAPLLSTIARRNPVVEITNADFLRFVVTFNEPVINVSAESFEVTVNGIIVEAFPGVVRQISPHQYEVDLFDMLENANGAVTLSLKTGSPLADVAGNVIISVTPTGGPAQTYTLDNTPGVFSEATSIVSSNMSFAIADGATMVSVFVELKDAEGNTLQGDQGAVTLSSTLGTFTPATATYRADINKYEAFLTSPNGAQGPAVVSASFGGTTITDNAIVHFDALPALASVTRNAPTSQSTSAIALEFGVTFNESVVNVSAGDFFLVESNPLTAATVTTVSGSGASYTVSVNIAPGQNGTVGLMLGSTDITDSTGNIVVTGPPPATNESFVIDNAVPATISCPDISAPRMTGSAITFSCTGAELGTTITVSGAVGSGANCLFDPQTPGLIHCSALASITGNLDITLTDQASNSTLAAQLAVVVDNTAPAAVTNCSFAPGSSVIPGAAITLTCDGVEAGASAAETNPIAALSCSQAGATVSCSGQAGTAGTASGAYNYAVLVSDAAGNTSPTVTTTLIIDGVAPVAPTCNAPAAAQTGAIVTLTCSGVETNAKILVNDGNLCGIESGSSMVSCNLTAGDSTGLINGNNNIAAVDAAGNSSTLVEVPFTVDDTVTPAACTTAPATANTGTPLTATCTGVETGGSMSISGYPSCGAETAGTVICSGGIAGSSAGQIGGDVLGSTIDAVGNTASTMVPFTLDDSGPSAATCNVTPALASIGVAVTAVCSGVETGGSLTVDGYSCGAPVLGVVTCIGTVGSNGLMGDATATNIDSVGNQTTSIATLTVDSTVAPAVCTTAPAIAKTGTALVVSCTGLEPGGSMIIPDYSSCGAETGGVVVCSGGVAGTVTGQISGDVLGTTMDAVGNTVSTSVPFTLDDVAPAAANCSVSPAVVSTGTSVTAMCSGIEVGGSLTIAGYNCPVPTGTTVTCTGTVGTNGLTGDAVVANIDSVGNQTTSTAALTVDDVPPTTPSCSAPVSAQTGSMVTLSCSAIEANATVTLNGSICGVAPAGGGVVSCNVTAGNTGGLRLQGGSNTVITVDVAGNVSTSAIVPFVLDDTVVPSACATAPAISNTGTPLTATCTGVETGGSVSIPGYPSCGPETAGVVICNGGIAGSSAGQIGGDVLGSTMDAVGNTVSTTVPFTLDDTAPAAAICSVLPAVATTGTAVTATCSGVETGGSLTVAGYNCATPAAGMVICTGTVGTNGLVGDAVVANIDSVGNQTTSTAALTVDDTVIPAACATAPAIANTGTALTVTCTGLETNGSISIPDYPSCGAETAGVVICNGGIAGSSTGQISGDVLATTMDAVGNTVSTSVSFTLDDTAPVAAACSVLPAIASTGTAVTVMCNGIEVGGTLTVAGYNCPVPTGTTVTCTGTVGANGLVGDAVVTNIDSVGNQTTSTAVLTVDDTVTSASCSTSPAVGNAGTPLTATCTGVETGGSVSIPGYPSCGPETAGVVICNGGIAGSSAGQIAGDVLGSTMDAVGNTVSTTVPFTLDDTAPAAAVCSVLPAVATTGTAVTATCSGVETTGSLTVAGYSCATPAAGMVICTGTIGSNGLVGDAVVTNIDSVGNQTISTAALTVDDVAPAAATCTVSPTVATTGTIVTAMCDGVEAGGSLTIAGYNCPTPTGSMVTCTGTVGSNGLTGDATVTNIDSVGNQTTSVATLTVDTTPPTHGSCSVLPSTDVKDGDAIAFACSNVEAGAIVSSAGLSCDPVSAAGDLNCAATSVSAATSYTVTLKDALGNSVDITVPLGFDNTPPAAAICVATPTIAKTGTAITVACTGVEPEGSVTVPGYTCDAPAQTGNVSCTGIAGENGLIGDAAVTTLDKVGNAAAATVPENIVALTIDDVPPAAVTCAVLPLLVNAGETVIATCSGIETGATITTLPNYSCTSIVAGTATCTGTAGELSGTVIGDEVAIISDAAGNQVSAPLMVIVDSDRDKIIDANDPDDDNDSIPDSIERTMGDSDGDGIANQYDKDDDNDGILSLYEGMGNPDGDTQPNYLDQDSDGDGAPDIIENGLLPTFPVNVGAGGLLIYVDVDSDGIPDYIDSDKDGLFGIDPGALDNNFDGVLDPTDTDCDGIPNYLDLDSDNDGIADNVEASHEVFVAVPDGINSLLVDSTADTNKDGVKDSITNSQDTDNDGIPDRLDLDSDNDSIFDVIEAGLVDANNDSFVDDNTIIDMLSALPNGDVLTETEFEPDFRDLDSNGDGENDIVAAGNAAMDLNGDGMVDAAGASGGQSKASVSANDADKDGILDMADSHTATYGNKPAHLNDSDNDGISDFHEGSFDFDSDGIADYLDLDSDGDGILDAVEGREDTDGDGRPNFKDTDSDNDGVSDSAENLDTNNDGVSDAIQSAVQGGRVASQNSSNNSSGGMMNYGMLLAMLGLVLLRSRRQYGKR